MGEISCEAAREAWTELAATTGGREAEELVIHRAILAERQRCADAVGGCRGLDENGYICEKSDALKAILNP